MPKQPTIYIGSDYMGFGLKQKLATFLKTQLQKSVADMGPEKKIEGDDAVDYAIKVGREVLKNKNNRGILICSSGHGMCITANKIRGIRASIGYNIMGAELMRLHTDANVLCLASKMISFEHACAIVKKFLDTKFDPIDRRVRRLKKLEKLEKTGKI